MLVHQKLIIWYKKNARDLPWRNTKDPYKIWLSEIILQQTKVDQGLPYYHAFIKNFSTIKKLADAKFDTILKLWQGLGYYNRAKNMHVTAKFLVNEFNGQFPDNYNDLLKLKGIGSYTAAAIASFAFNKPEAVLDGNVYRVLARFYGVNTAINSSLGKNEFTILAKDFLNHKNHAMHNQAVMELGATICLPKNYNCQICPLSNQCYALANKQQNTLPVKTPNLKPKNRYLNYVFVEHNQYTYIKQRDRTDIWAGLFEPILIEAENNLEITEFEKLLSEKDWFNKYETQLSFAYFTKHNLTHLTIYANFYIINAALKSNESYIKIKISDLENYPIHRLFEKFITKYKLQKNDS